MKCIQTEIKLNEYKRGFHVITEKILENIPEIKNFKYGMMNIFIKHTSASLTINENADFSVRKDFESHFNKIFPENQPYYDIFVNEDTNDLNRIYRGNVQTFEMEQRKKKEKIKKEQLLAKKKKEQLKKLDREKVYKELKGDSKLASFKKKFDISRYKRPKK